jgi:putative ABC transport system permease protein
LTQLLENVRYSLRLLAKQPAFTATAILILALGIGANSAMFSLVNGVLLKQLPYEDPESLYFLWNRNQARQRPQASFSTVEFLEYSRNPQGFERISATFNYTATVKIQGIPQRVYTTLVSPEYFETIGVRPSLGRGFEPEEGVPGRNKSVILTDACWRNRFGSDASILGKTLTVEGEPHTVVGILPPMPGDFRGAEMYLPLAFTEEQKEAREGRFLTVIGRLKRGWTPAQAEAALRAVSSRLAQEEPVSQSGWEVWLAPVLHEVTMEARQPLYLLSAAVALVLLIACANLASLLTVRASARRREVAVRAALGASKLRVAGQLLTESVTLAFFGGLAGLLVAALLVKAVAASEWVDLPRLADVRIDPAVLAYTLALSVLAGLLFGCAPALQTARVNVADVIREEARGSSGSLKRSLFRSVMVVFEVALSMILLVSAGLLLRTFENLGKIDPGFRSANVLTFRTTLPESAYPDPPRRVAYVNRLLERLRALPGVEAAGATTALPMMGVNWHASVTVDGRQDGGVAETVSYNTVTPGYLEAISAQLVRGRMINESDSLDSAPVVLVSEELAKRLFPGEDPLGRTIRMKVSRFESAPRIAGVVRNIRHLRPDEPPRPAVYQPYAQLPWQFLAFAVKTRGAPSAEAAAVRRVFLEVDPELPADRVMPLGSLVDRALAQQKLALYLLSGFALLAIVLASVGLYGVLAVAVAQRTREIGIRMAVGASAGDAVRLIVRQGLLLALCGIAAGLALAPLAVRTMSALLYGVAPHDPLTYAYVAVLLLVVALAACLLPALRAARVDPAVALRAE